MFQGSEMGDVEQMFDLFEEIQRELQQEGTGCILLHCLAK